MRPLEELIEAAEAIEPNVHDGARSTITMAITLHFHCAHCFGPLSACAWCTKKLNIIADVHSSPVIREIASGLVHYGGPA